MNTTLQYSSYEYMKEMRIAFLSSVIYHIYLLFPLSNDLFSVSWIAHLSFDWGRYRHRTISTSYKSKI